MILTNNNTMKSFMLARGFLGLISLALVGCGGVTGVDSNVFYQKPATGLFQTPDQFTTVGGRQVNIGRTYVKLENNVPTEIGWEFPADMLDNLPDTAFGAPAIYILPIPSELVNSPFKTVVFSDWAAGHPPAGTGDAPHIHPIFLMSNIQRPSANFAVESVQITNLDEIPTGYVFGGTIPAAGTIIAPGIGVAYEYPTAPQLQPGWNTTALNYFVYNGHVNGIGSGGTYDFLKNKRTETLSISQPKIYPKPGWYPTKQVVRFNAPTNTYFISLTDFVQASRWIN